MRGRGTLAAALLVAAGCGRIGFASQVDASSGSQDTALDAALPHIAWRTSFAYVASGSATTDTLQITPLAVGDLVMFQVSCSPMTTPTAVSFSAPGWSFMLVGPMFQSAGSGLWAASYAATVPSTAPVTVTATWTTPKCDAGSNLLGDEFANAAVDLHAESGATGNCMATAATAHADDAVWAACTSGGGTTAVGAGYTLGANDGTGDLSEYKLTSDPAGTMETATFTNADISNVMTLATLQPHSPT